VKYGLPHHFQSNSKPAAAPLNITRAKIKSYFYRVIAKNLRGQKDETKNERQRTEGTLKGRQFISFLTGRVRRIGPLKKTEQNINVHHPRWEEKQPVSGNLTRKVGQGFQGEKRYKTKDVSTTAGLVTPGGDLNGT